MRIEGPEPNSPTFFSRGCNFYLGCGHDFAPLLSTYRRENLKREASAQVRPSGRIDKTTRLKRSLVILGEV